MSSGGRPVARDQHLQGADAAAAAAATQNTLNYALGNLGGRQKAWMSAGAAVSPTPASIHPVATRRPSRNNPKPLSNHHAPHDTTSPQLANVLAHPAMNRPLPSPSTVLPSPAPSEEAERISTTPTLQFSSISTTDNAYASSSEAMPTEGRQAAPGRKRNANMDGMDTDKRYRPSPRTSLQQPSSAHTINTPICPSVFSSTHGVLQHHQGLLPYQSSYPLQTDWDIMYYQQFPETVPSNTMSEASASYVMPHPLNQTNQHTQQNSSVMSRLPPPPPGLEGQSPFAPAHPLWHHPLAPDPTASDPRGYGGSLGRPRGRPRIYPNPSRPRIPPQQAAPQPRQADKYRGRLLPRPGYREPQQRQPNPARFSLHQAHLRSPVLQAMNPERLYQYVKSFLQPPVRISEAGREVVKWTFTMTSQDMERIPQNINNSLGDPPLRLIDQNCRLLRLRCAKWPTTWRAPTEHTWATAETSWIPLSYFTFNGKHLEQRKKLHHGKDMPIDLTPYFKEGDNVLEIAILRQNGDDRYLQYLVAIEILSFKSHTTIIKQCKEQRYIDANETVERIKKKLAPADDDDELSIVESNLTIQLFDPFSASKICDIPVRSRACLHYDCFDLETFLKSRQLKGGASLADQWKCPICNSDARPDTLVVDGFLEQVHAKLTALGLADVTRAIIMSQDGSWQPKVEVRDPNGVQDRDTPDGDASAAKAPQRQPSTHAEVIDLSD